MPDSTAPGPAPGTAQGTEPATHVDVLIVGAGLSGIGAAWRLQQRCPGHSYAILEAREAIGGTWDLFRYPGVRSDSDMFTFAYPFQPWRGARSLPDGASIRQYIADTARDAGIERHIRFGTRVLRAQWSTAQARWTVHAQVGPERREYTCTWPAPVLRLLRLRAGPLTDLPGAADFAGRIVHPQAWPEDLDWAGRNVVVIGSGATAVTLVPALAATAAHVTMLQRSPT